MVDYQKNRALKIDGPGDMRGLMPTRLSAVERISRPFQFDVELVGVDEATRGGAADPDGILGRPVSITLASGGSVLRYFHGIVTEFAHTGFSERFHHYRAVLRPAFWLLTRRVDCRVLQNKSTPDIFAEVCQQAGFSDHRLALSASYDAWEYRVQYGESDFDFLSRLLEHEGIYYYFEHFKDKHVLVLADDVGKLESVSGYEKVPYYPQGGEAQRERDHLYSWSVVKSFEPSAFAAREYNFETPGAALSGASAVAKRQNASRFEVFEYPAGASKRTAAGVERVAKVRAEELQSSQTTAQAEGDAIGLAAGRLFTLDKHPRSDLNKRYLVVASSCEALSDAAQSGRASADGAQFSVSVEAIDAREPYRPARITPRPRIHGAQTALVVGIKGEEISVDKYGRVKVKFYWDRAETSDEKSSCWVRVAQGWAGKSWGMQFLPRIGQEVVVAFLEGDPDHPLIIGAVYNAAMMPPYELPTKQTQSGIKSHSTKDGAANAFNELRFDDKKGEEEIYLHAENNMQIVVENNQTITIGADKKDPGDRTTTLHNDDKLTVGRNLDVEVKEQEKRTVGKSRDTKVRENDALDVSKKYTLTAGDEISLTVGQAKIVMKSNGTIEISGMQVKIKGTSKVEIDGTQTAVSGQTVDVKGTKTAVEGSGMLDLKASGIASLKGSLTKIG
jgi:type VI secretion system secreted protein VgrG